jgi:hypothetical protein
MTERLDFDLSFRIRSHGRMPFVILDSQGRPLADHDGTAVLIPTKAEARAFLMPGDQGRGLAWIGGSRRWGWAGRPSSKKHRPLKVCHLRRSRRRRSALR